MEQEDLVPAGLVPLLGDEDDEEKGPPLSSAAVVFISTLIINLLVSIVAPFFPEYADEHYGTYTAHPHCPSTLPIQQLPSHRAWSGASGFTVGAIFATFPLAQMLASLLLGQWGAMVNRRTLLYAGTVSGLRTLCHHQGYRSSLDQSGVWPVYVCIVLIEWWCTQCCRQALLYGLCGYCWVEWAGRAGGWHTALRAIRLHHPLLRCSSSARPGRRMHDHQFPCNAH